MRPARGTTALGACQALVTSRTVQNEAMARPQCATAAAPAAAAAQEHERRHRLAISRAACERNQRFAVRLLRLFLPVLAPPFNDRRVCLEVARLQQQRPLGTAVSRVEDGFPSSHEHRARRKSSSHNSVCVCVQVEGTPPTSVPVRVRVWVRNASEPKRRLFWAPTSRSVACEAPTPLPSLPGPLMPSSAPSHQLHLSQRSAHLAALRHAQPLPCSVAARLPARQPLRHRLHWALSPTTPLSPRHPCPTPAHRSLRSGVPRGGRRRLRRPARSRVSLQDLHVQAPGDAAH